jgi:hypothetical protein
MKNDSISNAILSEAVSYGPPTQTPHSAFSHWPIAESHPGALETADTVANSPDSFDHVLRAVEACRLKPAGDFQRIVVILAPPDRQRSRLGGALAKRTRAIVATVASIRQRPRLEQLVGPSSPGLRPVLVVDQAEYLGRAELDFIKLLINLTPVVPVLLTTAPAYHRWRHCWPNEARQIHRRTHLVLERQPQAGIRFEQGGGVSQGQSSPVKVSKQSR